MWGCSVHGNLFEGLLVMACLLLSLYSPVWVLSHPDLLSVPLWIPSRSQRARVGFHKASSASLRLSSGKGNDDGELGA